jgi:hypothetical protein
MRLVENAAPPSATPRPSRQPGDNRLPRSI